MIRSPLRFLTAFALAAVLAACSSTDKKPDTLFDLGPSAPRAGNGIDAPLQALVVTDATGSAALESEKMYYRLNYADAMQARAYANSRWSTNPLEMVTLRLKTRLAQTGAKVLEPTDAATGVPILRVQVDDFMHTFESSSQSNGLVVVRASLFRGHSLVDQRTFTRSSPAPSADASGGARALAASMDGIADDIAGWLKRQNPGQR
jgi:cholesterol transport system auxiliary component